MLGINVKDTPFYKQSTTVVIGLIGVVYAFSVLADILIPLAFAGFLAVLLNPLSNWLERHKMPRVVAISVSLLIAIVVVAGLFYFLSTQMMQFGESLPMLKQKCTEIFADLKHWVSNHWGVAESKQDQMVKQTLDNSQALVGKTLNSVLGILSIVVLLPVYIFFLMLYKTLILQTLS